MGQSSKIFSLYDHQPSPEQAAMGSADRWWELAYTTEHSG
jgi:hypothetical protein